MAFRVVQAVFVSICCLPMALTASEALNTSETIPYSSLYSDSNSAVTYSRIHKCFCSANQVFIDEICQDNVTSIKALINEPLAITQVIGTEQIKEVFIEKLVCPPNYLYMMVPGDSFALRSSGKLFNTNYGLSLDFSNYCVEHVMSKGKDVKLEVHLCLPIPKVPRCCREDGQDDCGRTVNQTDATIAFKVGERKSQMKAETFSNSLKCREEEKISHIRVTSDGQRGQTARLKLTNEGLILAHKITVVGSTVYIPSPKYCLEVEEEDTVVSFASYCSPDAEITHNKACGNDSCFRKCCSEDEVFDMVNMGCTPVIKAEQWIPTFHNPKTLAKEPQTDGGINSVIGFPLDCDFFIASPNSDPPDNVKLLSNGSLYMEVWMVAVPPQQYCIDNFLYGSGMTQEALVCFHEIPEESSPSCQEIGGVIYPTLLLISCIFLGVTLAVYAIIPDLHAKVQGKCLIASITTLLTAYISLVIVQLGSHTLNENVCTVLGLVMQFSVLASFFWLNVMCYDIWRTLRSMQTGKESPAGSRRRFLLYSAYAWGCPLVITVVTIIMQYLPDTVNTTDLILPRFGETECFFPSDDEKALWLYFYGFISVILIVNLFFFGHLAVIFIRARKISELALGKKNQLHKEWAKLYLKLFLIMGITWIFEVTSWIEGSCGFWIVTDIINALRGFLIFVIFVCKKDIIRKLMSESSPAFHRMRATVRQSSMSFFSRSSKRTSNIFVDPTTTAAAAGENETTQGNNLNP